MSEYPFASFDDITEDNSGLQYPSFEKIEFYLPSWVAPRYCLPEKVRKEPVITTVDGFSLLSSLGVQAFNIDPRWWHKIQTDISKRRVEYPEMSDDGQRILDGCHRALLVMQIFNVVIIPVFYMKKR